ncbi:KUP system potassium uptake protein [Loktanella fryxellensis]|uniref:Probable potassium transport system protein Kup n=1 Tax=Loktanella fryxellensis TaxID=245187 RepID=A0A1H7ZLX0_9RHOB|nr:potassium transporter Kup [Loktanella fryxellensis]SEM59251.1 KUP system potassium uptake protein [Loktanella fryxellensis]
MSSVHAGAARSAARPASTAALAVGSVGVVYGDIGTSPLYALREGLHAATHGGAAQRGDVIGIVSLLLWLLILIATFKYVVLILRADNRGEGGTLSLLALGQKVMGQRHWLLILGVVGTALFFGDAIITPAISVLSAVEGVTLIVPAFDPYVVPVTIGILICLFAAQRRGTEGISRLFGPIMLAWFALMAAMGLIHIFDDPTIFRAFSPVPGVQYLFTHGASALVVLGSVFLAITGAEALYADMGHFGRQPIRLAWIFVVFPSLALSYLGQGAMVLSDPSTASNPFFLMAPTWTLPGLVAFATVATIIASQAVITGAFSVARQAVQLGLLPRMEIHHTSETQHGQIYIPRMNAILLVCVVVLVLAFGSSANLATAYGIAVTGEMLVTTILAFVVFRYVWKWSMPLTLAILVPLGVVEIALFAANMTKFLEGGYMPLAVAAMLVMVMLTWVRGNRIVQVKSRAGSIPLNTLIGSVAGSQNVRHVKGTAMFLTAEPIVAPPALLHNLKHNQVLHAHNYIVTVATSNAPHVPAADMVVTENLNDTFTRVFITFGYMDDPNVPRALRMAGKLGVKFEIMTTSFFINRRSFKLAEHSQMPGWQTRLYLAMTKTASNAPAYYHLPPNRVIELGQQIGI